jgi:hypothetical protein
MGSCCTKQQNKSSKSDPKLKYTRDGESEVNGKLDIENTDKKSQTIENQVG